MTKILATVGPISSGRNLKKILQKSDLIRLNMSHNSIQWHRKNINQIKKIDKNKLILLMIISLSNYKTIIKVLLIHSNLLLVMHLMRVMKK